ncbi:hypothetical protein B7494_g1705 [Chlorociboria aeruginascens]|nr:hypothetical protein B7494_g1705 [Chlorociboria aeruginascens]
MIVRVNDLFCIYLYFGVVELVNHVNCGRFAVTETSPAKSGEQLCHYLLHNRNRNSVNAVSVTRIERRGSSKEQNGGISAFIFEELGDLPKSSEPHVAQFPESTSAEKAASGPSSALDSPDLKSYAHAGFDTTSHDQVNRTRTDSEHMVNGSDSDNWTALFGDTFYTPTDEFNFTDFPTSAFSSVSSPTLPSDLNVSLDIGLLGMEESSSSPSQLRHSTEDGAMQTTPTTSINYPYPRSTGDRISQNLTQYLSNPNLPQDLHSSPMSPAPSLSPLSPDASAESEKHNISRIRFAGVQLVEFSASRLFLDSNLRSTRIMNERQNIEVNNSLRVFLEKGHRVALYSPVDFGFSDIEVENFDRDLVKSCIDASLDEVFGVNAYLDRDQIENLLNDVFSSKAVSKSQRALLFSVSAIGALILKSKQDEKLEISQSLDASNFFSSALRHRDAMITSEEPTIIGFQALITMIIFAQRCGSNIIKVLMANALHIIHRLDLNRKTSVKAQFNRYSEEQKFSRAFWMLYSVEIPHQMRVGLCSNLENGFIDIEPCWSSPASQISKPMEWLHIQCQYAKICHFIVKDLYSQDSLRASRDVIIAAIQNLYALLEDWKSSLPVPYQSISSARPSFLTDNCCGRQLALRLAYQYHEAVFTIHGRWLKLPTLDLSDEDKESLAQSENNCQSSANSVLQITSFLSSGELLSDVNGLRLCSTAASISFISTITSPSPRQHLACLAMAGALFSSLPMIENIPIDEITNLSMLAQRLLRPSSDQSNQM